MCDNCSHASNVKQKKFFKTSQWIKIGLPKKIGRLGLSKGDNVFALEEGADNGFSKHVGTVLDANLKKGVRNLLLLFFDACQFIFFYLLDKVPISGREQPGISKKTIP